MTTSALEHRGRAPVALGLAVLAPAFGLLAVRTPVGAAALAGGVAFAAFAIRSLAAAVGVFTALTFFAGSDLAGGARLLDLLSAGLVLGAAVAVAGEERWLARLASSFAVAGAIAFLAWTFASSLWAVDEGAALSGAFRLVQLVALFLIVAIAVPGPDDLRLVAVGFVSGAVLTIVAGALGLGAVDSGSGRFGAELGNPNNLAAVLLPALALAGLMAFAARSTAERLLLVGCVVVVSYGLLRTESRGGLVGLLVMAIAAAFLAGSARRPVSLLLALLLVAGVTYFALTAPQDRRHVTSFGTAETTGRADLWSLGLDMAEQHPLQGIGFDNFGVEGPAYLQGSTDVERVDLVLDGTQVHNTYLNVLTELGVVGLLLFVALVGSLLSRAAASVSALTAGGPRDELLARGVVIGAIGMLTAYVFFSAQFEKQLWIVLGMLLALPALARVERRSASRAGAALDAARAS